MTTLVTGATGFLGQFLLPHLQSLPNQGDFYTCALNAPEKTNFPAEVIDLTQLEKVRAFIHRIKPDRVYHLAGIARVSKEIPFESYFLHNTLSTHYLLESLSSLNKPVDFLLASSVHIYGNQTGLITERAESRPLEPYGFTKYLAEETLKSFVTQYPNIKGTIVRLYSCIGPNQPLGFVASDICKKISELKKSGGATLEVGPIDSYRKFTDVRDVVRTFPILMDSPGHSPLEIFNVASPHNTQVGEMIQTLLDLDKLKVKIVSRPAQINSFKGLDLDTSKMGKFIPESFFRPLNSTLKDILSSTPT